MHHVDVNLDGRVSGWISSDLSGCPRKISLVCQNSAVYIYASRPRQDVSAAGFSLFSGYDVRVSTASNLGNCAMKIGDEVIAITPSVTPTNRIAIFDSHYGDSISGWIRNPSGLTSLVFLTEDGPVYADILARPDVNELMEISGDVRLGFRVSNISFESIYAANINNSHVHWF